MHIEQTRYRPPTNQESSSLSNIGSCHDQTIPLTISQTLIVTQTIFSSPQNIWYTTRTSAMLLYAASPNTRTYKPWYHHHKSQDPESRLFWFRYHQRKLFLPTDPELSKIPILSFAVRFRYCKGGNLWLPTSSSTTRGHNNDTPHTHPAQKTIRFLRARWVVRPNSAPDSKNPRLTFKAIPKTQDPRILCARCELVILLPFMGFYHVRTRAEQTIARTHRQ